MAKAVKLSNHLVHKAMIRGQAVSRSTSGQIEYWANIGQIAEDNPDLPYLMIRDILIASQEVKSDDVSEYKFGEGE